MENQLGPVAGAVAVTSLANVALDELDQPGHFREVIEVSGAEVVDHGHLVAVVEQAPDNVRPYESGSAGDESLHEAPEG